MIRRRLALDPRRWLDAPAVIEQVGKVKVVRDDLLEGGSKLRFLPFLVQGAQEVVFGGPFCGGAPLALSVMGRESGQKVTLFFAGRKELHPRQLAERKNGARLELVYPGYMTVVQARAKAYAAEAGALFLPLGFDVPKAVEPFLEAIGKVRKRWGSPPEVWCCAGSGMLARCLGQGFPDSQVIAVAVGLKSRHGAQQMPPNVTIIDCAYKFERETPYNSPFPSCGNYDRKAWELCAQQAKPGALFWNVLGPTK